jgi:prevent-host-death family protein
MVLTSIRHARTNLAVLIERAERGEEIVIARGKKPVARLVPVTQLPNNRVAGMFKGEFKVAPAFFEPLPPDELAGWK